MFVCVLTPLWLMDLHEPNLAGRTRRGTDFKICREFHQLSYYNLRNVHMRVRVETSLAKALVLANN